MTETVAISLNVQEINKLSSEHRGIHMYIIWRGGGGDYKLESANIVCILHII